MAITVKWQGELVGAIENGQLASATKMFRGLWDEFQRDGVTLIGFPDPASEDKTEGDGVYTSQAIGLFLDQFLGAGFQVEGDDDGKQESSQNSMAHLPQKSV